MRFADVILDMLHIFELISAQPCPISHLAVLVYITGRRAGIVPVMYNVLIDSIHSIVV